LVVEDPHKPAYLSVIFPPQTIAEAAYFESSKIEPADADSKRIDIDKGNTVIESLDKPVSSISPQNLLLPSPHRITNALLGTTQSTILSVPPDVQIPFSLQD
jgi:hypothetical protein